MLTRANEKGEACRLDLLRFVSGWLAGSRRVRFPPAGRGEVAIGSDDKTQNNRIIKQFPN
jgi:hypothetical protein